MNNFVAIDIETANRTQGSICSIGLVKVINNEIAYKKEYLVKPKDNNFDSFLSNIHKINSQMVKDMPEFPAIWEEIKEHLENNVIVAHNTSFDINQLRAALGSYNIDYPEIKYVCTYKIAKTKLSSLLSYSLNSLCELYNIPLNHHNALSDAQASATLLLNFLDTTLDELIINSNMSYGLLSLENNTPFTTITKIQRNRGNYYNDVKAKNIVADVTIFNEEHPLYDCEVLFTGTLESLTRITAMKKVVNVGGTCADNVTKNTRYLVVGEQDERKFGKGHHSQKMKRALELKLAGQDIEMISESDFLAMFSYDLNNLINIDLINRNNAECLALGINNIFANKEVYITPKLNQKNPNYVQMVGNCGGFARHYNLEIDINFIVISQEEYQDFCENKIPDILQGVTFQDASFMRTVKVISEDILIKFLQASKNNEKYYL